MAEIRSVAFSEKKHTRLLKQVDALIADGRFSEVCREALTAYLFGGETVTLQTIYASLRRIEARLDRLGDTTVVQMTAGGGSDMAGAAGAAANLDEW